MGAAEARPANERGVAEPTARDGACALVMVGHC